MKKILLSLLVLCLFSCNSTELIEVRDDNGDLLETYNQTKEGVLHGIKTTYIDGKKYSEENFVDGVMNGLRTSYFANGQIEITENYTNDILEGSVKTYYEDGTLSQEALYEKGTLTGIVKSFYASGQLKEEVTFANNEENGPFKEYHENGQVSWEGTYVNGDNELGIIVNYDDQGQLIKKMQCDTFMGFSKCKTIWPEEGVQKAESK